MTLQEWSAAVRAEFTAAGFEVSEYHGFPLVTCPADVESGVRLLKFRSQFPLDKRIYAEGMLLVPAGSPR